MSESQYSWSWTLTQRNIIHEQWYYTLFSLMAGLGWRWWIIIHTRPNVFALFIWPTWATHVSRLPLTAGGTTHMPPKVCVQDGRTERKRKKKHPKVHGQTQILLLSSTSRFHVGFAFPLASWLEDLLMQNYSNYKLYTLSSRRQCVVRCRTPPGSQSRSLSRRWQQM